MRRFSPSLTALVALAVLLRAAAILAYPQPLQSDGLAYFTMARALADGAPMRDMFGSAAFYSPGYPLLLGTVFAVFGAAVSVALVLNLLLAAITALLIDRLANALGASPMARTLAVAGYAIWLPSLLAAATLAKENLSIPLLLGFVLAALAIQTGQHRKRAAAVAGLCYGAGLLAGASTLPVAAAMVVALWPMLRAGALHAATGIALAFAVATAVPLAPWLVHTTQLFGRPILTTNGGFNLYLGNNPAATGAFVSIADTPMGHRWHAMRAGLGEARSADALGKEAIAYAASHPAETARLALVKIGLFWAPNVPDARDGAAGVLLAIRWVDVVQHIAILLFAAIGIWRLRRQQPLALVLMVITAFWMIHAATYVMTRYREPAMPMMLVLAAIGLAGARERRLWA